MTAQGTRYWFETRIGEFEYVALNLTHGVILDPSLPAARCLAEGLGGAATAELASHHVASATLRDLDLVLVACAELGLPDLREAKIRDYRWLLHLAHASLGRDAVLYSSAMYQDWPEAEPDRWGGADTLSDLATPWVMEGHDVDHAAHERRFRARVDRLLAPFVIRPPTD